MRKVETLTNLLDSFRMFQYVSVFYSLYHVGKTRQNSVLKGYSIFSKDFTHFLL